ncbi:hypothetical protein TEA_026203 [Camellia sinensis var. sinensis]|uniref:AIR9-like A9 domain-containing protein n=1 Tax=Camellia sinensis var. sinensis TaxID=542762 RepID=A0A4S4F1K1_CAMSN|nr:hypothetical protein TEA_026203 [Camellia sinensis var. sinensis]
MQLTLFSRETINAMTSNNSSMNGHHNDGVQTHGSDFSSRHNSETNSVSRNLRGNSTLNNFHDPEAMELYSRATAQQEEILFLRKQIAVACVKELQLLNEKYDLERKLAELRLAIDDKRNEAINSDSNELASRKGHLEENLKLAYELKATEEERCIFTSSMSGLLADYAIWPHVINASSLSSSVKMLMVVYGVGLKGKLSYLSSTQLKGQLRLYLPNSELVIFQDISGFHLHDQLQLKIRTSHARIAELMPMVGNHAGDGWLDKDGPDPSLVNSQFPNRYSGWQSSVSNHSIGEQQLESIDKMPRDWLDNDHTEMKSFMGNHEMQQPSNNDNPLKVAPNTDRSGLGIPFGHNKCFKFVKVGMGKGNLRNLIIFHCQEQELQSSLPSSAIVRMSSWEIGSPNPGGLSDRSGLNRRFDSPEESTYDSSFRFPTGHDGVGSVVSEGDPGIEDFQIIGEAKPGGVLLGCGYPVRGTSLCVFQWVRHLQDGTRQYIEGATNPEYVVTADDVDKLIAVECIPMDDQGHQVFYDLCFKDVVLCVIYGMRKANRGDEVGQWLHGSKGNTKGELVKRFANDQNKITCDPDMQLEIDTHISKGQATFSVLLLMDSSENWEPSTLILKRSNYQIELNKTQVVAIAEKFSKDLSNCGPRVEVGVGVGVVPCGTTPMLMRDTLVLTMRMFQSKALDERRKGKA